MKRIHFDAHDPRHKNGPGKAGSGSPVNSGAEKEINRAIKGDLQALHYVSADRPIPLAHTKNLLAEYIRDENERGWFMNAFTRIGRRPWFAGSLLTAAIAVLVLLVPFSYDRTVGQEVNLTVASPELTQEGIGRIANELAGSLGANDLTIRNAAGVNSFVVTARVDDRTSGKAMRTTMAFARALESEGYRAEASVEPIVERVSSNVYAAGFDRVCSISIDAVGRSDSEVEDDIRNQLISSGCFDNPEVRFTRSGDTSTITIQDENCDVDGGVGGFKCELKIEGDTPNGLEHEMLMIEAEGKTDAELEASIREQLEAKGIYDADISVSDGKVKVEIHKER